MSTFEEEIRKIEEEKKEITEKYAKLNAQIEAETKEVLAVAKAEKERQAPILAEMKKTQKELDKIDVTDLSQSDRYMELLDKLSKLHADLNEKDLIREYLKNKKEH